MTTNENVKADEREAVPSWMPVKGPKLRDACIRCGKFEMFAMLVDKGQHVEGEKCFACNAMWTNNYPLGLATLDGKLASDTGRPPELVALVDHLAAEIEAERATDSQLAELVQLETDGNWPVGDHRWLRLHSLRDLIGLRMARELIALRAGYAEHERKFEAGAGWFREMADRPMPCGHTIGDLIGGDGSVTACGACLAEKRPGVIKALRAEVERLRAVEALQVQAVDAALVKHAAAVGVVGPMPVQKASER